MTRDHPGPSGTTGTTGATGAPRPAVVLLHGWSGSADIDWSGAYGPLGQRSRVVGVNLHGHGPGPHPPHRFEVASCADDVAGLIDALALGPAVVVGHSLGGMVAQELWRRHPQDVAGLVLCSTAAHFRDGRFERLRIGLLRPLAALLRRTPEPLRRPILERFRRRQLAGHAANPWMADDVEAADQLTLMQAAGTVWGFDSRSWVGSIDVPTAVVVTLQDEVILTRRQRALAGLLPAPVVIEVDGPHSMLEDQPGAMAAVVAEAIEHVMAAP